MFGAVGRENFCFVRTSRKPAKVLTSYQETLHPWDPFCTVLEQTLKITDGCVIDAKRVFVMENLVLNESFVGPALVQWEFSLNS